MNVKFSAVLVTMALIISGSCLQAQNLPSFTTLSQGEWGTGFGANHEHLVHIMTKYHPEGISVGCSNQIVLKTPEDVARFLPSGTSPKPLPYGIITNPGPEQRNSLAGEVITLQLNIELNKEAGLDLQNLSIAKGEMKGKIVNEVLEEASRKLGGCYSVYSYDLLRESLYAINRNFQQGKDQQGYLSITGELSSEKVAVNNN